MAVTSASQYVGTSKVRMPNVELPMTPPHSDLSGSEDEAELTKAQAARLAAARKDRVPASAAEEEVDAQGFADSNLPDDYVSRTLAREPALPPIQWKNILSEIQWVSFIVLTSTPILAAYGLATTKLSWQTATWSVIYYFITGLGITAGYHRLWAHRAYNASRPLEYALMLGGTGAVEGSIHWWARGHRAHHRYTDTDLDPYGAHFGLLWSHVGWMIVKPRRKPGVADISDLRRNSVIKFQHKYYIPLILIMGFIFPTLVAGLGWNDWRGGFFYAAVARLVFVHHSTFAVNSIAHWLGEASFDNKMTPRDHFITALVTVGEGYHNFHHQFPADYRNATKWYQYDPTKWFIASMKVLGLASHLKQFPDNEVQKGRLAMKLSKIHKEQEQLAFPKHANDLPVVTWDEFVEEAKTRPLMVLHGFVIDVSSFLDEHPGGRHLLRAKIGKDATTAFSGGVYDHSNAAANLASMLRVGVIDGGYQLAIHDLERAEKAKKAAAASGSTEAASIPTIDSRATAEKIPHPDAVKYVVPGEAYLINKQAELRENSVAARSGGQVGGLLWKKKSA